MYVWYSFKYLKMLNPVFQKELNLLIGIRREVDTAKITGNIHRRQFTMKDAGVSSRLLNHWEKSGLLMEQYEERKWKKFNLMEYTWLKIITEMRRYDLSHEVIRNAKKEIDFDFRTKDMPNQKDIFEIMQEIPDQKDKAKVKNLINTVELKAQISDFKINYLEIMILYIIILKGNYSILVNIEGECIPFKHSNFEDYMQHEEFSEFLSGTFVSISVTEILKEFLIKNELSLPKKKLFLLSESESQAISTIRDEDVTSVKIRKGGSNEIEFIEEFKSEKIDKAARLMDVILKHGYQTIEIKTQDGEIVHCSNQIKHKV